ncbi:MAG TPA: efflux RND transporter periplasmic adaptor subunit [Candidatus Acidoferrum sp.]|nr:efflux RND transporter periplasmic adaptor subunit [Candidatus Acidoferrum sp.]
MKLTKKCPPRQSILARSAAYAVFGALLLCGCGQAEKMQEPVVSVQVMPAQRGPISQVITSEAVVYPLEQATVAPKITSTVKKFYVQRGTRVKKGQLLVVLENADLAAATEASKGDFEQADAAYNTTIGASLPQQIQKAQLDAQTAQSSFDAQLKIFDSRKELFQQGAIPRRELDAAEVALTQARSQNEQAQKQLADFQRLGKQQALKSAEGSRLSAEGKYRGAAAQLSYSEIRSPIDGVVTDRPLYEGDPATANQPILTVMNLSRLIAKAHIVQAEAAALKVGNPAELKVPGADEPIQARVTLVSPALDPGSTTIEVWAEATKPDPALKPGMTIQVSLTAKTVKDATLVPTSALFKSTVGADYVLLAGSDHLAHQKIVQVGIRNGGFAQIVSGINAGDPVITSGGYALPDKTQVKIEAPAPANTEAGDQPGKARDSAKPDDKDKE